MNHGTLTNYVNRKCRCQACCAAARRYNKRLRLQKQEGKPRKVDSSRARQHVANLRAQGMPLTQIAHAAGWKRYQNLQEALKQDWILTRTEARILAVQPHEDMRPLVYVDATGSRRRLQALARLGWSQRKLAHHIDSDHKTTQRIQNGQLPQIRRHTAERITALYDQLWDKPGPSPRTIQHAIRQGWALPLEWDDDALDNPDATPHIVPNVNRNRRTPEHLLEDYIDTWDHHQGDLVLAADRLSMKRDSLQTALIRLARDGYDVPRAQVAS